MNNSRGFAHFFWTTVAACCAFFGMYNGWDHPHYGAIAAGAVFALLAIAWRPT